MDNPILLDFPYSFETERLIIRGPLPDDAAPLRQAVVESQPELKPWMPWAVEVPSEEWYRVRVREGRLKFLAREDLWMMLTLKENGLMIGGSGLHRIDWSVPKFEIGYWARTSHAGQGYITEAVNGITRFAFETLGAQRVEIRCDVNNERSAAVARRAGFTHEGTLRHDARDHITGGLRDTHVFAQVRAD
ncbi:MAG: GNAT family N-acetyltransferase [Candidatus Promineofilum sp.]|jgi:RimJ/RimL family protein N-acetyltransferase|nr:GNAT family N-acetyltransferase [Promineifilum sp.]